jgi:hypothetical protein
MRAVRKSRKLLISQPDRILAKQRVIYEVCIAEEPFGGPGGRGGRLMPELAALELREKK